MYSKSLNFLILKILSFSSLLFIFLFILSCSSSKPFKMDLIIFDKTFYEATDPSIINVYNTRLDLPRKYLEIGSIKYEGDVDYEALKKLASSKGADALLLDGNNFILLKFIPAEAPYDQKSKSI